MHQSTADTEGNDVKRPGLWGEGMFLLHPCFSFSGSSVAQDSPTHKLKCYNTFLTCQDVLRQNLG